MVWAKIRILLLHSVAELALKFNIRLLSLDLVKLVLHAGALVH